MLAAAADAVIALFGVAGAGAVVALAVVATAAAATAAAKVGRVAWPGCLGVEFVEGVVLGGVQGVAGSLFEPFEVVLTRRFGRGRHLGIKLSLPIVLKLL